MPCCPWGHRAATPDENDEKDEGDRWPAATPKGCSTITTPSDWRPWSPTAQISGRELVEAAIARIEDRNPTLNAVVATRFDAALAEADAGSTGPLAGVPFLVKDLGCDVAGLPATRGSRLWRDHVAPADSELARRYKAAGLLILGNTNSPEMGKNASTEPVLHGPTHNPWRTTHSTGGSSGGSAASVAAGIVPAAHANDGGGSIRIPASSCGLFGLKPTRGRTPAWPGPGPGAYPMGIGHAVTRTVRDSAALLDVVAGPMPGDAYASPAAPPEGSFTAALGAPRETLRIGFGTTPLNGEEAHPDAVDAVHRVAALLTDLGHRVEEASPTYDPAAVVTAMSTIMGAVSAVAIEDRLAELGRPLADDDLEALTRAIHDGVAQAPAVALARAQIAVEQGEPRSRALPRGLRPVAHSHDRRSRAAARTPRHDGPPGDVHQGRPLRPVHRGVQRDRSAGDVGARRPRPRRAPVRTAVRGTPRRGGDPAAPRRRARGGHALAPARPLAADRLSSNHLSPARPSPTGPLSSEPDYFRLNDGRPCGGMSG